MLFSDIANFACAKVGKIDTYSVAQALAFTQARHKMIYESFNWKAAQTVIWPTVPAGDTIDTIYVPSLSHVTSVSVNGQLLDPVSTSYIFESAADDYDTPSTKPKFYDEFYLDKDQTPGIRFYPPLDTSNINITYKVVVLGKRVFNPLAVTVSVPHVENALIAFVIGDMWEYLHQVGKAQTKFQEANALLKEAQDADTPPALRPRMTVPLTATGNTLGELTDSVCNLIGKYDPDTRTSVKERIRRNYQMVVDAALWPELSVVVNLNVNYDAGATDVSFKGQVIVPDYIEKVISVRTNLFQSDINAGRTLAQNPTQLGYQDLQTWFGVQPQVFETVGTPLKFSFLPPIGVSVLPTQGEQIKFELSRATADVRERIDVFVKGTLQGQEKYETVDVWADTIIGEFSTPNETLNQYDTPVTIAKPITLGTLTVTGADTGTQYVVLPPNEREKRYMRLMLLPNTNVATTPVPESQVVTVFLLGKQKVSSLVDDQDSCQIRNVENILINASAADMMYAIDKDRAAALKAKADTAMLTLIDAETKQNAYNPVIVPYTEPSPLALYSI